MERGGSVAAICRGGTLVGSMLPLLFRRLDVAPGVASSPFVATFVDVTGIIIYFLMARLILSNLLMEGTREQKAPRATVVDRSPRAPAGRLGG